MNDKKPLSFLRGSLGWRFAPTVHIVQIETRNGAKIFQRVSLNNTEQMAKAESLLMELQHAGEIRSYLLAAANDTDFPSLMRWLGEIGKPAQQDELISIEQNTLFSGGDRRCNRSYFEDGGRTETTCGKDAEFVCAGPDCENVRCDRCDDLSFDEVGGVTLCEECQTAKGKIA